MSPFSASWTQFLLHILPKITCRDDAERHHRLDCSARHDAGGYAPDSKEHHLGPGYSPRHEEPQNHRHSLAANLAGGGVLGALRPHFPGEIASALTKAERQKLIAVGNAHLLIQDILNTPPVLYAIDSLVQPAVDISSQTRAGFYDCLYVALAEQEN